MLEQVSYTFFSWTIFGFCYWMVYINYVATYIKIMEKEAESQVKLERERELHSDGERETERQREEGKSLENYGKRSWEPGETRGGERVTQWRRERQREREGGRMILLKERDIYIYIYV